MSLLALSPLQLGFHGLADELGSPVRSGQYVDPRHDRLRQANLRGLVSERRASHRTRTSRYRFFGQGLHIFGIAYLTTLIGTVYIDGIG